jgi:glycosyltransferase involved in cell wall biosynthesis
MSLILASHPSGNANVRELALSLAERHRLAGMATGLALHGPPSAWMPLPWQRQLQRRRWSTAVEPHLISDPWPELLSLGLSRLPVLRGTSWPTRLVNRQIRHHDHHVARLLRSGSLPLTTRAFYGYEDAAAESLLAARQRGWITFLELPTLHAQRVRQLQAEEAARRPQWRHLLPALQEPAWKLRRKSTELATAHTIVVPSVLVKQSCVQAGLPASKVAVVPYGAPQVASPVARAQSSAVVLYVGRITPAKGLDHLLQAWRRLEHPLAELWLVGSCDYPRAWLEQLPAGVRWCGSVPQAELQRFFAQAQLFVMPSLLEGYNMAALEAMAAGLPVLITDLCGVTDVVTHGSNGWIVPAADCVALATVLEQALADPQGCARMGLAAHERAQRYTWVDYRRAVFALLEERLCSFSG